MNRWRAEYDDGIWRFYRDGMELGLYEKGDVVVDALNVAESRIAELEGLVDKLIEVGDELADDREYQDVLVDLWHDVTRGLERRSDGKKAKGR